MKLLTRDTDYAVRALCFMAKTKDRLVSIPEIVKSLNVPRPFIRKILQILGKRGIVRSYRGIGGGFKLAIPPEKILLTDLINIFQGSVKFNECVFKKKICPNRGTCPLKKKIDRIEASVASELKAIAISSLIR